MPVNTKAKIRASWGENRPVTGPYDPALAAACSNGTFVGSRKDSLLIFRGIPFACPPVGELRWKKPRPAPDGGGVFEAKYNGRTPIQTEWPTERASYYPQGEDCLYLNVWTNAKKPDEKLPVLVWFFGGGLQCGYPAEMEFDGERIARRGVVVVTVNYRVGALGFLTHPQISREQPDAPANFGNLDQQAGLRWVQRNISAFGGDPSRVTIAGQSAGGGSVMSQLACKANEGLFRNTVVMSAMIFDPYLRREIGRPELLKDAEKKGEDFFAFLGVKTLEEARGLDAVTLQRSYEKYMESHVPFFTVQDDLFCVGDPIALYRKGYCYCFTPDMPGWDNPGTFHSSDLWFWFETLAKCWRPFTGRHYDLARQMCDYFCNFIKTGDPNGKDLCGLDLPRWETWSEEKPCTMMFLRDGAAPTTEPLTPFKRFICARIMDRMRKI